MKRTTIGLFGLVLGGLLLLGAEAHAIPVTYTAIGSFGLPTDPIDTTFTAPGVMITYNTPGSQPVEAPTNVSFGSFTTAGTTATSPVAISTPFTLRIFQAVPSLGGPIDFVGAISGTLEIDASGAVLQFSGPLTQSIGLVTYQIANAADSVPGRILIGSPMSGPPDNRGVTAIEGRINVIPEPSAMALVGLGALAPLALTLRRRIKARAAV